MKILFIDDNPLGKITPIIEYCKLEQIEFQYEIVQSVNSAIKYIFSNLNEIDLIVSDLGLPRYDDGSDYGILNGLDIIDELIRKNINIPIIINSTTDIPNLRKYADLNTPINQRFYYVQSLNGLLLKLYLKKYFK